MINKDKVYSLFNKRYGGLALSTNGWYDCRCPKCGKRKLAINFKYMVVKCWRGCYDSTYVPEFIKNDFGINYFEAVEMIESQDTSTITIPKRIIKTRSDEIKLPNGYRTILSPNPGLVGQRAIKYLEKRGFDLNYLDMIGVGYCDKEDKDIRDNYFGYIIIPFKRNGVLVYFIGRNFMGDGLRYKNPARERYGVGKAEVLFNSDALSIYDKVYLTEGWACAASIGPKGISMQGSSLSSRQVAEINKSQVKEVVIIPDASFYKEGLKNAAKLLDFKKVKVMNLDWFEKSNMGKDVNEIGWDLVKSKQYEFEYLTKLKWYKAMRNA